ncbi:MAG: hypothetical protein EAX96_10650 [Candidatus Lokiarchaeota archaeon]|nr:hypothetical protein [Candidatus Lokiarchaeota archaeon]
MLQHFEEINILDNFYQTSSFYPMPVVLVTTISETGQINIGPYSLCFPFKIAGNGQHAMILISRNTSNTAQNIIRTKVCAINFISDNKKFLKNTVKLGYPGDNTEEKMKNSIFTLIPSSRNKENPDKNFPDIIKEAEQVYECTWDDCIDFSAVDESEENAEKHFFLRIDKILLKPKWKEAILQSNEKFPSLPVDYGFRNNYYFWFSQTKKPYKEPISGGKNANLQAIMYAAQRTDPDIKWTEEACEKIIRVPRIFLGKVLKGCVEKAKEMGVDTITAEVMDRIRDKRSDEKN